MKLSFSQRHGYKSIRDSFQTDNIDATTKNGLWNVLSNCYWDKLHKKDGMFRNKQLEKFIHLIWSDYFKKTTDTINLIWGNNYTLIRNYFFHEQRKWYEIYDFLEFIANNNVYKISVFKDEINKILEREMSAYRFVGDCITPIIDEVEINEVVGAIENSKAKFAAKHLSLALDMLSDRQNPDYRNSIKESISAVEGIAKSISGDSKGELKSALKALEERLGVQMHGALREGFLKIYGYTSDGYGIRHSLTEEPNLSFEDAKFMLVACSSFVNYLIAKSDKAGISL
ncbi:AbiJ-NTD4 domain-containing protein [Cytobacillus firmus]|uniref:AbiJ-NTD4 domain-containing protein n=1 Tax=Cytobacillus firmus TaxID=1399 RepID=UPI0036C96939